MIPPAPPSTDAACTVDTGPTTATLAQGDLRLTVSLPGEAGTYRGNRFAWAGVIHEVHLGGHVLFGPWRPGVTLPLDEHDNVAGTAGEFGMGSAGMPPPLGYAEAAPGETFVKVGVGVLRRRDERPYSFSGRYDQVELPPWETTATSPAEIAMRQRLSHGGYGYDYTHTIALGADGRSFETRHTLTNTGERPLHQTHYSHNFIAFDGRTIGPDYEVELPFTPINVIPPTANGYATGPTVRFRHDFAPATAFYTELAGYERSTAHNAVTVRNRATGIALRVTGDRALERFHLFAAPGAVCPEPFVDLRLAPGESTQWQHHYDILIDG